MGRRYNPESPVIKNPLAYDIIKTLGLSPDEIRYLDYSHCETLEELEFEILTELLCNGIPEKEARIRAREEAREMWEENLKAEKGL